MAAPPVTAPSAEELIRRLTTGETSQVRGLAAFQIGENKYLQALDALLKALENDDDFVRGFVLHALGELRQQSTFNTLAWIHQDARESAEIRKLALQAICKFASSQAVGIMLVALQSEDREVVNAAVQGLGASRSPRALHPLWSKAKKEMDNQALAEALIRIPGADKAIMELLLLKHKNREYDMVFAVYCGHFGPYKNKELLPVFIKGYLSLDEGQDAVRNRLAKAIRFVNPQESWCMVRASALRIRERPNIRASVTGLMQHEALAVVLERSKIRYQVDEFSDYWYRVRTDEGKTGWAFGGYLRVFNPAQY